MPTEVLYLGPVAHVASAQAELGRSAHVSHATTAADVDRVIGEAEVVLDASMAVPFTAERIGAATRLRLYVTATTGADHVDANTLAQRGVPLLTLRGQHEVLGRLTPAAEHSWALLLACARQLPAATADVVEGRWDRTARPGIMLRGRVLGLLGCGRIGSWVGRYARAFDMDVIGFDPHLASFPEWITPRELDEVIRTADVVSVHVPLDDSTRGLLSAKRIRSMKQGALVVNTSRGEILDEAALAAAIRDGHLAGAGVDVLTGEPDIASSPLRALAAEHPRVVITPHIGGFSPDAVDQVVRFSAARIRSWLDSA